MMVIPLLSILATVAAAVARAPGRAIGLAIAPLGLVVVQVLIIAVGKALSDGDDTTPAALVIYGLHAINGLAIMAVAGMNLAGVAAAAVRGAGVSAAQLMLLDLVVSVVAAGAWIGRRPLGEDPGAAPGGPGRHRGAGRPRSRCWPGRAGGSCRRR